MNIGLPYQLRWIYDKSDVKIGVKSRQIGLTWINAAEDVLTAGATREAGGMDCYYLCQSKDDARQYVEGDCTMWAEHFGQFCELSEELLIDPEDHHAYQVTRIKFASGFSIRSMVAHPRNLRGKRGKITLDEAAYNANAHDFLPAALPFIRWGGRIAIISTEASEDTEFHRWRREVESGDPARKDWSLHVITFDDAIRDGLFRRICMRRGEPWSAERERQWRESEISALQDRADSELFCVPIGSGSVYIGRATVAANRDPTVPAVLRVRAPRDLVDRDETAVLNWAESWVSSAWDPSCFSTVHRQYVGVDVGRSRDLFSLVVVDVSPTGDRRVLTVIELDNVPFAAQRVIIRHVVDRLPRFGSLTIDAGGHGSDMAEHLRHAYGRQVQGVQIGVGKAREDRPAHHVMYSELLPPLKRALQNKALALPDDSQISDDITRLQLVDGMPRIPSTRTRAAGQTRHCDTACALALALLAADTEAAGNYGSVQPDPIDSWWGV